MRATRPPRTAEPASEPPEGSSPRRQTAFFPARRPLPRSRLCFNERTIPDPGTVVCDIVTTLRNYSPCTNPQRPGYRKKYRQSPVCREPGRPPDDDPGSPKLSVTALEPEQAVFVLRVTYEKAAFWYFPVHEQLIRFSIPGCAIVSKTGTMQGLL